MQITRHLRDAVMDADTSEEWTGVIPLAGACPSRWPVLWFFNYGLLCSGRGSLLLVRIGPY